MQKSVFQRIFNYINIFSIDVVIGSVMMGIYASRILEVHPTIWWYLILAMSVWVFYTADHLLDALKGKERSTIQRHIAHYTHRNRIIPLWVIIALFSGIMALLKLDTRIIYTGMLLGLFILIYFVLLYFNRKRFPWLLQKELIIGLIYVAGIWLAPIYWYGSIPPGMIQLLMVNMILLTWSEGILISWFEQEEDLQNNHPSFTTLFGKKTAMEFVFILLLLVTGTAIYILYFTTPDYILKIAFIIQILMSLSLCVILLFSKHYRRQQLYRYFGEITFWLPGLILLT